MTAVGFRVSGQYPRPAGGSADSFLDACEAFFAALPGPYPFTFTTGRDLDDRPTLFVGVHPAAEPMYVTDCGEWRAATSAAIAVDATPHFTLLDSALWAVNALRPRSVVSRTGSPRRSAQTRSQCDSTRGTNVSTGA